MVTLVINYVDPDSKIGSDWFRISEEGLQRRMKKPGPLSCDTCGRWSVPGAKSSDYEKGPYHTLYWDHVVYFNKVLSRPQLK